MGHSPLFEPFQLSLQVGEHQAGVEVGIDTDETALGLS